MWRYFIWHLPVCDLCWAHVSSLQCFQSLCRPLWACCLGWMRGDRWRPLLWLLQPQLQLQRSTLWVHRPLSIIKPLFPGLYIPDLEWSQCKHLKLDWLISFYVSSCCRLRRLVDNDFWNCGAGSSHVTKENIGLRAPIISCNTHEIIIISNKLLFPLR